MPQLQCPRCGKRFPVQPGDEQVCPACSYRGKSSGNVAPAKGVVARPPRAWVALLLGIGSLGVWPAIQRYRVYENLDRQHGRSSNLGMFLMSLVPILGLPFYIGHAFGSAKRLKDYRRARGLGAGPGALWHLLLRVPIQLAFFAVLVVIYINDWDAFGWNAFGYSQFNGGIEEGFRAIFDDVSFPDQLPRFDVWSYIAVAFVGVVLSSISAAILARSTRKLWRAIYQEQGALWPFKDA